MNGNYTLRDFTPLLSIFLIIIVLTCARQLYEGWNLKNAMSDFMGFFFIIFGAFKIINWNGFVEAYQMYDIIAQKSVWYAYAYPLIELVLGIAYLWRWNPMLTNLATFIVMGISSIGVAKELLKNKQIVCACLGAVFKVPMTWVTFFEDILMAAMALFMLIW